MPDLASPHVVDVEPHETYVVIRTGDRRPFYARCHSCSWRRTSVSPAAAAAMASAHHRAPDGQLAGQRRITW